MMSPAEMDRRRRITRAAMDHASLDWIVCTLGHPLGYAKWLADRVGLAGTLVALPLQGDLILATHGDAVHHKPYDTPGIRHIASAAQPNLRANTQAPGLIALIAQTKPRRIGFLGLGYLAAATYKLFLEQLPQVEFVDATDLIAPLKAVKSEEEMVCMRAAAALHDAAIDVARQALRPGVTGDDVIDAVRQYVCRHGSRSQTFMAGSAPPGEPCRYGGPVDRVVRAGDQFSILIECSEKSGYYSEAFPIMCLGEIPKPLQKAFDDALEVQALLAGLARPGADMMALLRVNDEFMTARGYPAEKRLLGHAQGLDLVERPAMTPTGENLLLQADTVLSIHPTTHGAQAWGIPISVSYFVTEHGTVPMLKTPNRIIVVDA